MHMRAFFSRILRVALMQIPLTDTMPFFPEFYTDQAKPDSPALCGLPYNCTMYKSQLIRGRYPNEAWYGGIA